MIDGSNRARILKADKDLEDRIGSGPLDPVVVANCQKIILEDRQFLSVHFAGIWAVR